MLKGDLQQLLGPVIIFCKVSGIYPRESFTSMSPPEPTGSRRQLSLHNRFLLSCSFLHCLDLLVLWLNLIFSSQKRPLILICTFSWLTVASAAHTLGIFHFLSNQEQLGNIFHQLERFTHSEGHRNGPMIVPRIKILLFLTLSLLLLVSCLQDIKFTPVMTADGKVPFGIFGMVFNLPPLYARILRVTREIAEVLPFLALVTGPNMMFLSIIYVLQKCARNLTGFRDGKLIGLKELQDVAHAHRSLLIILRQTNECFGKGVMCLFLVMVLSLVFCTPLAVLLILTDGLLPNFHFLFR